MPENNKKNVDETPGLREIVLDSIGEDKNSPRPKEVPKPNEPKERRLPPAPVKNEAEAFKPLEAVLVSKKKETIKKALPAPEISRNLQETGKKSNRSPENTKLKTEKTAVKRKTAKRVKQPKSVLIEETIEKATKKNDHIEKKCNFKIYFFHFLFIFAILLVIIYFLFMFQALSLILN
jgi:hypothetical protein